MHKHLKLLNLTLQRIFPKYNIDSFKLIIDLFKNIINYPAELEYFFDPYIINKINNYNYQYFLHEQLDIEGYDKEYIRKLTRDSVSSKEYCNYALIAV